MEVEIVVKVDGRSTAKNLVGILLKGPGMHWSPHGATAITALRAQNLNQA